VRLAAIHTAAVYDRAVEFMKQLLDVVGNDEEHELADMLELLRQLVKDFEHTNLSLPDATPGQVLRFLMDQHELKQAALAHEIGAQSVVSEILNGYRQINARQAKAQAQSFGVSSSVFI
jgi:HTH-type transcriptional regulator/antitoxin HigA